MGLRDLLNKKDGLDRDEGETDRAEAVRSLSGPEFTFIRSDTLSHEVIQPPNNDSDDGNFLSAKAKEPSRTRRSLDVFRPSRSRSGSASSATSHNSNKDGRRISQRLHLSRQPKTSENVPDNLPAIVVAPGSEDAAESQWEKRATMLAEQNELARSCPSTPATPDGMSRMTLDNHAPQAVSSKEIDEDIQQAIRLHEAGDLDQSTKLFGRLADPKGANNPLSQVLYGLALR